MGFAHLKNIEFTMAKKCFDTAFDIDPYNPNTNCALGLLIMNLAILEKHDNFMLIR